ncbi:MAG TPA: hypothetical protein VHL14_15690 [Steroidobacteraceae bacterium]|nr:hypothetical protein [Steroidobacteraceae bacterium]
MQQQVNLYQPVIVKGSSLVTSRTVSMALGAVLVLLLGIYIYGIYAVSRLSQHVTEARSQQEKQTALLTLNAVNAKSTNLVDLQTQVRKLNATLSDHRRALQLLRVGVAGGDSGFSERLIALANQHIDGLWLERIVLGSTNGVESLGGGTNDADLIPRYIASLSTEPALRGTRINQFQIVGKNVTVDSGKPADTIQFSATSLNTLPVKAQNESDAQHPPVTAKAMMRKEGQS